MVSGGDEGLRCRQACCHDAEDQTQAEGQHPIDDSG